ncbi:putative transposon, En/Spm-like protein [Tanacetum coccineum]|uniref:Transposon, En/Spm-like protein n=1 Tax=Tanacetum coccineum TaxID=301880 RepID=A0ABQ5GKQ3_9ASTR
MDKSWMRTSRTKKQYIDGVEAFIKYAVHNLQKMRNIDPRGNKQQLMMPCPCTTCLNHIEHKVEEVQFHLFKYGIDLSYTKWDKHREKDEQATTAQIPVNATIEFVDDTDFDMDFGSEIPTDGPATVEMVNATKESFDEDDLAKFQELLLDAEKEKRRTTLQRMINKNYQWTVANNCILTGSVNKELTVLSKLMGYLDEPLVDDLDTLFETWVDTYDASIKENFNLRAIVLWTINDYPALEKNVCESLVGTFLNVPGKTKDGMNARLDQAELGIKPELFARQEKDKTTLPPAGYTLMNAEKDIFCETLSNIRVPQGYCSNFSSLVSLKDRKLIGLKLHDYHMLMQEFMPTAIRSIMHPPTRYAIIRFCFFFKYICRKEISLQELDKMQLELVVTLCLLEKFFPLPFFDIMIHLTVHLTREVKLCGPICFRWMYPFERCMKVIKGHVRNRNRPEGCIAEETIAEETIEFFREYHKTMKTIGIPPDKHVTNENEDGKPLSAGKSSKVSEEVFQKAHLYVIQNTDEIVPYIKRHKQVLKTKNPGKRIALLENKHSKSFAKWLREENNRVSVEAIYLHKSKEVTTIRKAFYYGVLQEIWVLDYHFRKIPLFKCDWVNHKAGGVKHDPNLGYTLVDLNSLGHKDDPFILASQARQVLYVKDQIDKKLSIVFRTLTKNYKDTYDGVDKEFSTVIHEHNDNILPRVNRRDLGNESQNDFYRTDCEESI